MRQQPCALLLALLSMEWAEVSADSMRQTPEPTQSQNEHLLSVKAVTVLAPFQVLIRLQLSLQLTSLEALAEPSFVIPLQTAPQ